jgi:predicted enzyme related to lactoylglutathione lyase
MSDKTADLWTPSRRLVLAAAGAAALPFKALAQDAAAPAGGPRPPPGPPPTAAEIAAQLPLKTTGLEHVSIQVPDVQAAAEFYGKVFNPKLRKEKDPPLRYYVPLKVGYIAIGAARDRPVIIDHYCALVENYNRAAMTERLKQEGLQTGRFGMFPDPDGAQLQLLGVPGGWAPTIIDADPISTAPPVVQPIALENVIIQVSDLEKALAWYRKFFTGKLTRAGPDRAWIQIAGTRLGLQKAAGETKPGISSFCVTVARYDHKAVPGQIEKLGGEIIKTTAQDKGVLRFRSPMGLMVDIKEA